MQSKVKGKNIVPSRLLLELRYLDCYHRLKLKRKQRNCSRKRFFYVQIEMNKTVWLCGVVDVVEVGDKMIYSITHKNRNSEVKATYKVVHDIREESFDCSCNHFVRNGILCRHAFKVMLNSDVQSIPEKYILPRWRGELVPVELLPARARFGEMDVGEASYDQPRCIEQKRNEIQKLLCVSEPESVDMLPPTGIRNRGCGTGKRLVGMSERASINAKKPKRLCRTCEKMGWHDSRNCPSNGDGTK
ncbi:uncharacterized protein LOC112524992 [Cynara cardunculus var. scolymus]|uniref:uncharacterized protein LOC112524992 n=1 Tax=Cynara cardunculus var. scolymus TaxID=59895 RepID=UPI000D630B0B|nr:uncharacterized protein LOC112524992 [Cynara cardunculus var. scolymus]